MAPCGRAGAGNAAAGPRGVRPGGGHPDWVFRSAREALWWSRPDILVAPVVGGEKATRGYVRGSGGFFGAKPPAQPKYPTTTTTGVLMRTGTPNRGVHRPGAPHAAPPPLSRLPRARTAPLWSCRPTVFQNSQSCFETYSTGFAVPALCGYILERKGFGGANRGSYIWQPASYASPRP